MRRAAAQPLTERQRRIAFGAASALVLAAAIALGAVAPFRTSNPRTENPPAAAPTAPRIADAISTSSATPARPDARRTAASAPTSQLAARDEHRIDTQARTFLAAYLAYEVGALDATERAKLNASATRALARRLIDHPVDLPPRDRPAVGHVQSLALNGGGGGQSITIAARIEQAGWVTGLTLQFEHAHGRWLVASVA
jgi:hypothetical protein